MQFFKKTNIDFVGKRGFFFVLSSVLIVCGILAVLILGVSYGIDFTGGAEVAIKFEKEISTDVLRSSLAKAGLVNEEIKSFGEANQFLIRSKDAEKLSERIQQALQKTLPDNKIEILKEDNVGPKIGSELRTQAIIAVFLAVIAMLIYIAFRFEFVFGLGAIVALIHDVIFTFSFIVVVHHLGLMNLELNQTILAAMLTVVGYSINDTVIIFDRIRENREKHKGLSFRKLVNLSINETLSRTINTVITVLLVLITMVLLAGPVLQGFAFTMLVGIITGTYSSIFIASSFVIWYLERMKKEKFEEPEPKPKAVNV